MIDRATIDRIKDAADIVDVVSEFISLKKVGVNFRGLCPFHNDRTPSFYVSPSRGTCHCFTCGEGGDSVGFLMKHEQLTYPEALRWLAKRYGIEIKEEKLSDEQIKEQSDREGMFIANEWASKYFEDILHNDVDGRAIGLQYFRHRGFRDDIIRKFRLGFSLSDRHALPRKAREEGYSEEYLLKTGLCFARDNTNSRNQERLVDRFSGRAIFPWIGISGKVVAFGGRVLDSRTKGVDQKYVNSPDSPIYHKDHELYGIFQAKKAIGKEGCVYMVEGYTDVISMHQCGLENVVANSGTALSPHQIRLLHRFTQNIVLLYDGDAAGIHAALRGTDMLLADGMNVKVMLLPDGEDPDSFARSHSAADFKQYIEEHQTDFIEFKTRVLLQGVTDPRKRSEAINSIIKSVSVITDPIVRASYIKDCSSRFGIGEQTLLTTMNDFIRNYREEQRQEEERQRNRQQAQATAQQTSSTSSPGSTNTAPPPASTTPQGGYDDGMQPPPDAFLPPEAFSQPEQREPQPPQVQQAPTQQAPSTYYPQGGGRSVQQTVAAKALNTLDVESMLIRAVVKYGERIMYSNVESADGENISLNVAQYVDYDLSTDNLSFNNPLYNQILAEAVAHSADEDFVAEKYFLRHPDYEVSNCAIELTEEQVQLSKTLAMKYDEDTLREHVLHLVLDFRKSFVEQRLSTLRIEIGLATADHDKMLSLMSEYQKLQAIRNAIAKKLGSSILARR